jgi:hypothetical protein
MSDKLKWVATGGGPLILVSVEVAHRWRGDETIWPPTGDLETIWEAVRRNSDHGRAFGGDDYLVMLGVGSGECQVPAHEA